MRKILLVSLASIAIVSGFVGYHFTDSSIQSRAKDVALNSDACLFFSSSSEYGEKPRFIVLTEIHLVLSKGRHLV